MGFPPARASLAGVLGHVAGIHVAGIHVAGIHVAGGRVAGAYYFVQGRS